jgi:hypothetical protein
MLKVTACWGQDWGRAFPLSWGISRKGRNGFGAPHSWEYGLLGFPALCCLRGIPHVRHTHIIPPPHKPRTCIPHRDVPYDTHHMHIDHKPDIHMYYTLGKYRCTTRVCTAHTHTACMHGSFKHTSYAHTTPTAHIYHAKQIHTHYIRHKHSTYTAPTTYCVYHMHTFHRHTNTHTQDHADPTCWTLPYQVQPQHLPWGPWHCEVT